MNPFKVWVILAMLFALVYACSEAHSMTISTPDNGGNVGAYLLRRDQLNRSGEDVRIFSPCLSACALFLGARRVCVGSGAVIGFHQTSHPAVTRIYLRQLPPAIRAWIKARGGLRRSFIYLKGAELRRYVRSCK